MVKERINRIFRSKIFYMIFSVIAAFALWMYVSIVENPDVTVPVSGIQVRLTGEDILANHNLMVTSVSQKTLRLDFSGKRNDVSILSSSNVTVSLDLTNIANAGLPGVFQLTYTVNYPSGVGFGKAVVTGASANVIAVTVEKTSEKTVPVKGEYSGGVADGYMAEPMTFSPQVITVKGPESIVNKISYAWVNFHHVNLSDSVTEKVPLTLMDANGVEVLSDRLTLNQSDVTVTLNVDIVKEVPLTVDMITGAGATASNTVITILPATVTLSGDTATLKDLNKIVLGAVDLSKFVSTTTLTLPIVLPNGVKNMSGGASATVQVEVKGLDSKQFAVSNIQTTNLKLGLSAEIISQSITVTLRGSTADLKNINPANIRIVADLSELGDATGYYSVKAKINVDGYPNVGAIGDYTVDVRISKG